MKKLLLAKVKLKIPRFKYGIIYSILSFVVLSIWLVSKAWDIPIYSLVGDPAEVMGLKPYVGILSPLGNRNDVGALHP